ncbi:uncharacterized protein LOC143630027 [Bidens hawaiensis]|uniref:uncharacterized protein LOC143630027 n=1 Tax=Bidens hawaiensis TaxID=980011 RepID=UPI00404AA60A
MRSNGELMPDVKIVEKILRTLYEKYMYVVVSIEESNNIDEMTINELHSSLVVNEQKFKKVDREDEQALKIEDNDGSESRGRGSNGSKEANFSGFDEGEEIMLMVEVDKEENCYIVHTNDGSKNSFWFSDSGCSNNMCGIREKFVQLDQNFSTSVRLGNNSRMNVCGKGNVKLVMNGAVFVINDVYYVPDLKNYFLSIGQLQ